jgi:outer membrane receptor for ferrienterochelin and colicins
LRHTAIIALAAWLTGLLFSTAVHAQQAPPLPEQSEDGITVYGPEFFAPYRPSHAKDMLERVPGAAGALSNAAGSLGGDDDRRGLRSQTTQVLINGKRLTTKGNSIQDYFERIPASQVERIELITGNVKEIDADVGSRVINVVLADTGSIGGTWNFGNVSFTDDQHMPTLAGSISGEPGNWSYTLSGESRPRQLPRVQRELFSNSTGALIVDNQETRRMNSRRYIGRGRVAYNFGKDHQVQLSGFIEERPISNQRDVEFVFDVDDTGGRIGNGGKIEQLSGEDLKYEISGDYSIPLTNSLSFKSLFVYAVNQEDRENEDFGFADDPESPTLTSGDSRDQKATEKILRGTLDWAFAKTQSLEIGVEGAVNSLDKTQTFFDVANGIQTARDVFNADQIVSEDRVEAFANHTWRPTPKLEVETGIAAEFSWLDQLGSDVDTSRKFNFAKPSVDVYYTASDRTQFFSSARRDVGQLEFNDFIADLDRDDGEIDAGNPNLAPEKSWDFEVGTEHRLANQAGVINLRAFYRDVSDVTDIVPFGIADSAPGNLGAGTHYGAELETSLQLRQLGLIDAVISATLLWQDSRVEDPFTGLTRRFSNQNTFKLNIDARHDIQAWAISYGAVIQKNGPKIRSDFNTVERESTGADVRLFFEKRFENGIVGRLFWGNVLRPTTKRSRTVFVTSQADGQILRTEFRTQKQGGFYGFGVRGTF